MASAAANKENALNVTAAHEVAVRHTPVKVFPSFLSPTSNASSMTTISAHSPLSAASSASTSSAVLRPSPRQPLAVVSGPVANAGSPAVLSPPAEEQRKAKVAHRFLKPTSFHNKAKRISPPSSAPPVLRPTRSSATASRPSPATQPRSAGAVRSQPRPSARPSSNSPRLRSQLIALQSALSEEKERSAALRAEVQGLRAQLAEAQRRDRGEDVDDALGKYWHPAAPWDFYSAVNSEPSSASDRDSDGEEDPQEEGGDDGDSAEDAAASDEAESAEEEEEDEDEDEEDDHDSGEDGEDDEDASDLPTSASDATPAKRSGRRFNGRSPASAEDDDLSRQMAATAITDSVAAAPRAGRQSIELTSFAAADVDAGNRGDAESDGDDGNSHRSQSTASAAVSECSVLSSPGFHDAFPYERNLYLLSRHYHFQHRLYSCPDAVTFKAVHIASSAAVVIKVSEGFSASRSHPKEVRLLTRAQGHPNVMRLRGWYGLEATGCYAFVTDFVDNVGVERVWGSEDTRRRYMEGLLSGLAHLHARGILYRDVKPSNVLWDERRQSATIIDFDVATLFDPQRLHRSVVGTTGFMAPEMTRLDDIDHAADADGYDRQVDVYSAGVVLGQLLFKVHEDEVADVERADTKGPAMVQRVLDWAAQHGGRIGAEYHLLLRMLTAEPRLRITVQEALQHPYFARSAQR